MSSLTKMVSQTLCCFYVPQSTEDSQPSPKHRILTSIGRKPEPYAMINVPHEPEMTDIHAFRKLFTQSPACPHQDTPLQTRSRKGQPSGSLDLNYTFHTGSPSGLNGPKKSTSFQKLKGHIKSKVSQSRMSTHSSKRESQELHDEKDCKKFDPQSDSQAIMLSMSAQSTDLGEILDARYGSLSAYDSDAKSIRTPYLVSPATTMKVSTKALHNELDSSDDRREEVSPLSQATTHSPQRPGISARKVKSSPFPSTPEKLTFSQALQLRSDESPTIALKRLSAGMADGSIKPPTESELRTLRTPRAGRDQRSDSPLQPPRRSSSLTKQVDTPQTIVKRLSKCVKDQEKRIPSNGTEHTPANALNQVDPALLEYLSRFTPEKQSHKSNETSPQTAIRDEESIEAVSESQIGEIIITSPEREADIQSMKSATPSEKPSIHLFNMQISHRLASKSNGTMLSPSTSANTSRKSLDIPPVPTLVVNANGLKVPQTPKVRNEHNRRPSDPQTKKLFEYAGRSPVVPWRRTSMRHDQEKEDRDQFDDASSCYTDHTVHSCQARHPSLDGTVGSDAHPNSLAIGGRSAAHSRRTSTLSRPRTSQDEYRSISMPFPVHDVQLESATQVIGRYTRTSSDITVELSSQSKAKAIPSTYSHHAARKSDQSTIIDLDRIADEEQSTYKPSTVLDAPKHEAKKGTPVTKQTNFQSSISRQVITPLSRDTPPGETVTQMWNRVYRKARQASGEPEFLSTPTIDMDTLRRRSSVDTLQVRTKRSAILHTPKSAIRKSRSLGIIETSADSPLIGFKKKASETLRRLSLLSLKPRTSVTDGDGPRKLRKRSTPDLSEKSSQMLSPGTRQKAFRAGDTPPLKELLRMWASFPSHDRDKRNGSANDSDSVHTHDFAVHQGTLDSSSPQTSNMTTPGTTFNISKPWRILSVKDRHESSNTQNMSLPSDSGNRFSKGSTTTLINRWKNLYRTRSSEWRGYMNSGGRRSSVFGGESLEYPELEVLPGEGLNTFSRLHRQSQGLDGHSCQTHLNHARPFQSKSLSSALSAKQTQTLMPLQTARGSSSSIWEPVMHTSSEAIESPSNSFHYPGQHNRSSSADRAGRSNVFSTRHRQSMQLKIPGSFHHPD